MTVYFVRANNLIKIGYAENIRTRLTQIAASFDGGLELVAMCDGGREVEAAFHSMFSDSRVEGEWFACTPLLEATIAKLAHNVGEHRFFGSQQKIDLRCSDKALARKLLEKLFAGGVWSIAKNLEACFQKLSVINPDWSRRRVRSMWHGEARHISFSEIADLACASEIEAFQLAELIIESSTAVPSQVAA